MAKKPLVVRVSCPKCHFEEKIHVAPRSGPGRTTNEIVPCLNCNELVKVKLPGKMTGGPFPG